MKGTRLHHTEHELGAGRMLFANGFSGNRKLNVNRMTGELTLDRAFRDVDSTRPGIAFDRAAWPHGPTGTGVPHGTVFGW